MIVLAIATTIEKWIATAKSKTAGKHKLSNPAKVAKGAAVICQIIHHGVTIQRVLKINFASTVQTAFIVKVLVSATVTARRKMQKVMFVKTVPLQLI